VNLADLAPFTGAVVTLALGLPKLVGGRSPYRQRLRQSTDLAQLQAVLPNGPDTVLDSELQEQLDALRREAHYLRVRRRDNVTVVTVIVLAVVIGALTTLAIWFATLAAYVVCISLALFLSGVLLAGVGQIYYVPSGDKISPERAYRKPQGK
jgi:uncharacterized membrane protein